MASLLEVMGHDVKYMDEIVRDHGLGKQELYHRRLTSDGYEDKKLDISREDFQNQKMQDFRGLSSEDFIKKYGAFKPEGIERVIVKTGNSIAETLQEIEKDMPDIIGIPLIATANYIPATTLAQEIRKKFPGIKLITG